MLRPICASAIITILSADDPDNEYSLLKVAALTGNDKIGIIPTTITTDNNSDKTLLCHISYVLLNVTKFFFIF